MQQSATHPGGCVALCLNDDTKEHPMDIRDTIHAEHTKTLDTDGLRAHFPISGLFAHDAMNRPIRTTTV